MAPGPEGVVQAPSAARWEGSGQHQAREPAAPAPVSRRSTPLPAQTRLGADFGKLGPRAPRNLRLPPGPRLPTPVLHRAPRAAVTMESSSELLFYVNGRKVSARGAARSFDPPPLIPRALGAHAAGASGTCQAFCCGQGFASETALGSWTTIFHMFPFSLLPRHPRRLATLL